MMRYSDTATSRARGFKDFNNISSMTKEPNMPPRKPSLPPPPNPRILAEGALLIARIALDDLAEALDTLEALLPPMPERDAPKPRSRRRARDDPRQPTRVR